MIEPIIYSGQKADELFKNRVAGEDVDAAVKAILNDVKKNGDAAVRAYSAKFDGYTGESLVVSDREFEEALANLSTEYIDTLKHAIANIAKFHKKQLRKPFKLKYENKILGEKITPVAVAGIYVPGGTAAYPSTVLMNAVPAKIAGVKTVIMATPVKADGKVKGEVLAAAKLCGVDIVYKMGGAQAIAAMAYGTETVIKADKITGPGRNYVAAAKKLVYGEACGIDMIAGPSEILVIADKGAKPEYVAADLLSQAEHDVIASALLITDSLTQAEAVISEIYKQVEKLERKQIALTSIKNNCKIIVVDNLMKGVELANEYAPEHLELAVAEPFKLLDAVKNAGSVFLGYNTPEAVGDYYAGANHTLPTGGTAKYSSPLGVADFQKVTQYVYYSQEELKEASSDIILFAESEGLGGHARSVSIRTSK